MNINDLKIGMTVYHRDVYSHKEHLTVIGITETEIKVRGNFSGGTHNIIQDTWLPIKGTSVVYDYDYKDNCRKQAVIIKEFLETNIDRKKDTMTKNIADLLEMVFKLTTDASLNGVL